MNVALRVARPGAEGNVLSLRAAEGPGQFKELITDSWCRPPL